MVETISRDDIDAAWLSGIMDGEGCIHTGINRTKTGRYGSSYPLRVEVSNTNPYMVQKITQILYRWGVKFIVVFVNTSRYVEHHQDKMVVLVQSYRGCYEFLRRIVPHMTAKVDEAQAVIDFCKWRIETFGEDIRGRSERKTAIQMEVYGRKKQLHETLRRLKDRRYRLQRLPRGYSQPLPLESLEMYFDENGAGRRRLQGKKKEVVAVEGIV